MNLQWTLDDRVWMLHDPEMPFAMAFLDRTEKPGVYGIRWWTTANDDEVEKHVVFAGAFKAARAYTVALVRFGVPE
jgi:hypothetical protein